MLADLLALAATSPHLEGARCRDNPRGWDVGAPLKQRAQAAEICVRQCPVLADCTLWLTGLDPDQRPSGTVARKYLPPGSTRSVGPRASSSRPSPETERAADWLQCRLAGRGLMPSAAVKADAARPALSATPVEPYRPGGTECVDCYRWRAGFRRRTPTKETRP